MDTNQNDPDIFDDASQRLFDLEAAEGLLAEERTQLAAAKLGLALALAGLLSDVDPEVLRKAVARHTQTIDVVRTYIERPGVVDAVTQGSSTP